MSETLLIRKKPITVEAMQFDGSPESAMAIVRWVTSEGGNAIANAGERTVTISTLEGEMLAAPHWYIIKGVKGEFYPCDPEVFNESYDVIG